MKVIDPLRTVTEGSPRRQSPPSTRSLVVIGRYEESPLDWPMRTSFILDECRPSLGVTESSPRRQPPWANGSGIQKLLSDRLDVRSSSWMRSFARALASSCAIFIQMNAQLLPDFSRLILGKNSHFEISHFETCLFIAHACLVCSTARKARTTGALLAHCTRCAVHIAQ